MISQEKNASTGLWKGKQFKHIPFNLCLIRFLARLEYIYLNMFYKIDALHELVRNRNIFIGAAQPAILFASYHYYTGNLNSESRRDYFMVKLI